MSLITVWVGLLLGKTGSLQVQEEVPNMAEQIWMAIWGLQVIALVSTAEVQLRLLINQFSLSLLMEH